LHLTKNCLRYKTCCILIFASKDNNIIYTCHNDEENKDVYMVALRDDDGTLIGYYEKHEYRNRETAQFYQPKK